MNIPTRYRPHSRPLTAALLLALAAGFSAPFIAMPPATAATTPPAGTVELSPTPVSATQSVPPNIMLTFDDSGSMQSTRMSDTPPYGTSSDWSDGPWRCANVIDPDHPTASDAGMRALAMNGVYYNPNITYVPPLYADSTSFPNADAKLQAVWVDGMTVNRPLSPASKTGAVGNNNNPDLDLPSSAAQTNLMSTSSLWKCGTGSAAGGGGGDMWNGASPMDGKSHTLSDGTVVTYPNGGPYYYRFKTGVSVPLDKYGNPTAAGLNVLYNSSNWEAMPVQASQYQNFANWYAYYRTRNQMARSAMSRVFGSSSLAGPTQTGGYGGTIRVAWQNLNTSSFKLPSLAIISSLIDTSNCTSGGSADPKTTQRAGAVTTPPDCYRSAFFNWIFQIPASGGTPTRSAIDRAGQFFTRGYGNTGGTGNLQDPYWQPPASGTGNGYELSCRQNYHMLVTDGLWNGSADGPTYSSLTLAASGVTLPDNVSFPSPATAGVTSIYAPVHDSGDAGYASLSDVAFNYWATDLRTDLYDPPNGKFVSPYLPDTTTSVFSLTGTTNSNVSTTNVNPEIYFNPKNDPATWPHMADYLIGLGVSGVLNFSDNTDCTDTTTGVKQDACDLRKGITNSNNAIGWPTPNGQGGGIAANIDDTWHAALAGRGQFFSAGNPQQLVDQLSSVLSNIAARAAAPTTGGTNASVLSQGALSFNTGYSSADWTGVLQAVTINSDGSLGSVAWDAGKTLTGTAASARQILTAITNGGSIQGAAFQPATKFDTVESTGLQTPALSGTNDTLANRVNYLRGDRTHEKDGTYRTRNSLLGAIINSQPLYVSYPASGYTNTWPSGSPEAATGAQTYDAFYNTWQNRAGTVYVGANDGMLHAFAAPAPTCTAKDSNGNCTAYDYGTGGQERWGYVPRAVYGNLGNLTSLNFKFAPTVDATPKTRDVFFSTDQKWHSLLVGGVGLGGRGVYAIDITDPTAVTEASASSKVLWEFDSDATVTTGCVSNIGSCRATDLGYTFGTPNIGRLANGEWVVLVSTGYFPDCSQTDKPSPCDSSQAPKDASGNPYSALFVLDARTGAMVAELKTPTNLKLADGTGNFTSFGLATPVLGDYNHDQIDDVAFAGDLQGNLWRFDLGNSDPTKWSVALTYQGIDSSGSQGIQPITSMPRLFPDPATNRFMVVFGTGKYLGAGDNTSTSAAVQSVYGVRDEVDGSGNPITITQSTLVAQTLGETTITDTSNPLFGATLRTLTNNAVGQSAGGWYFNLQTTVSGSVTDAGERVVVTPGALFNTNTAIIASLIPGNSDPCNPSAKGAVMFVDATTGGAGNGLSSLGGQPYVGGRVDNVPISGSLPIASALGGGSLPIPGLTYSGSKNKTQVTGDTAIWRRRSWQEIEIQQ